ncbi:mannosyltransferase, partial [Coemansia sp. RSA 1285]
SILRAKAISSAEDVVSSSDDSGDEVSDSDESEGSGFEKGDQISRSRKPGNSQQNAEVDVLKRFKPFNISAISSAAEAFGIQFSTSLLTKAAKQLELYKTGNQHNANEMPSLQGAEADLCSSSVELGLQSDTASESHDLHQPDVSTRPDASKVSATAATLSESNIGNLEDDIPPPIDISGLAALLGDSTLASALEDPSKAQMILEYVKGLLKAKNQQGDGNAAQHKIGSIQTEGVYIAKYVVIMDMRKRRKPRGGDPVQKPRQAKTVAVLVLGDIGQSPRMQYHALSLARAGHSVEFVGYKGSKPMESLLTSPKINIRYVRTLPRPTAMPQPVFYAYAPIKVVCQTFMLLWMLLVTMPRLDYMIIQNPPAIPTLAVARICTCLTDTRLIIDWHNYGYTILGLKLGEGHLVTRLAKW